MGEKTQLKIVLIGEKINSMEYVSRNWLWNLGRMFKRYVSINEALVNTGQTFVALGERCFRWNYGIMNCVRVVGKFRKSMQYIFWYAHINQLNRLGKKDFMIFLNGLGRNTQTRYFTNDWKLLVWGRIYNWFG